MRKILIFCFIGLFLLVTLPWLAIIALIGLFHIPTRNKLAFGLLQRLTRSILFMAGAKVDVRGVENIPKDNSLLFVGNHRSLVDVLLILAYLPRPAGFIAKDSLGKVPVLSWWMLCFSCLFLDRNSSRNALNTILKGIENMKNGICYIIFPEGTRNMDNNELLPFKKGSLKLAEKSDSLIIPFALRGTDEMFEKNNYNVKPGNLYLYFGEPVDLKALTPEETKISNEYMMEKVKTLFDSSFKSE